MDEGCLVQPERAHIRGDDSGSAPFDIIDEHRVGEHVDLQVPPPIRGRNGFQCVVDLVDGIAGS